jgi:Ca2+-transporting ATPase
MGITGTEVTKEAAEMILTDDNFATIVKAVDGGRGLYDNLMKYVRFQIVVLIGYIALFVLAGIFDVADGIPLKPLQVLWINFAIDVLLAIGLGFDEATPGIMERKPRAADAPVVTKPLGLRLGTAGILLSVVTLIVVAYGDHQYSLEIALTMGLVTLSLLHVITAIETRDPEHSALGMHTVSNPKFNQMILASLVLTLLVTELSFMQRIFETTSLNSAQWGICLLAALVLIVVTEVAKLVLRRTGWAPTSPATSGEVQPQALSAQAVP